jgi:flagellar biosynthesis protein FlhA
MVLEPTGATPVVPQVEGITGKDPTFGLPALWILVADRRRAEEAGLTVVDAASVMTTHLGEALRRNAHELLGRQEVQELLGVCAKDAPKLVEDTIPGAVTLGELVRVLRGLLREGLSVRDLRTILESVADAAPRSKDTAFLIEQTRRRLFRQITARLADAHGVVHALTLDRASEDLLRKALAQADGEATLGLDVETARRLIGAVETRAAALAAGGRPAVLVAPPDLRRPLFDLLSRFITDLFVVNVRELAPGTPIEPAGALDLFAPPVGRAA